MQICNKCRKEGGCRQEGGYRQEMDAIKKRMHSQEMDADKKVM
jgi:hypothetical protein